MKPPETPDSPDKADNADIGRPFSCGQSGEKGATAKTTRQETALRALIAAGEAHDDIPDNLKLHCAPPVPADCVGTPTYEGSCCGSPEV